MNRHAHGSAQFNYVLSGGLEVELNGVMHRVAAGSAIHIPAGARHAITAAAGGETVYIVLKNKACGVDVTIV